MTFEEYLLNKKIDAKTFQTAELELYKTWEAEFFQMHSNSFTAQKLYLINPIRLKYRLPQSSTNIKLTAKNEDNGDKLVSETVHQTQPTTPALDVKHETGDVKPMQPAKPARPIFKSKPKTI